MFYCTAVPIFGFETSGIAFDTKLFLEVILSKLNYGILNIHKNGILHVQYIGVQSVLTISSNYIE
jgi:hypothetical protein